MENTESKRGRPKAEGACEALQARIENLENLVVRLAHVEGRSRYVIEYGLKPYKPESSNG